MQELKEEDEWRTLGQSQRIEEGAELQQIWLRMFEELIESRELLDEN